MKKAIAALEFNIRVCRTCVAKYHDQSVWKDEIDQCTQAIEALKAIELEDAEKQAFDDKTSAEFDALFGGANGALANLSIRSAP